MISSHTLYKTKEQDEYTPYCKARIAPHGNEDYEMAKLETERDICPPDGLRVFLAVYVSF